MDYSGHIPLDTLGPSFKGRTWSIEFAKHPDHLEIVIDKCFRTYAIYEKNGVIEALNQAANAVARHPSVLGEAALYVIIFKRFPTYANAVAPGRPSSRWKKSFDFLQREGKLPWELLLLGSIPTTWTKAKWSNRLLRLSHNNPYVMSYIGGIAETGIPRKFWVDHDHRDPLFTNMVMDTDLAFKVLNESNRILPRNPVTEYELWFAYMEIRDRKNTDLFDSKFRRDFNRIGAPIDIVFSYD